MPISVKDSGSYKLVYAVWQKVDDVWVEVPTIHYRIGGSWKKVHSKLTPFIFNKTISVNTYGYDLRDDALLAGWDGINPLLATVTINVGVVVGAINANNFGFSTGLSFPQGSKLTLINNGTIAGMGGRGASSGLLGNYLDGFEGQKGGTALFVNIPTSLYNNGSILAGGGGGGGGAMLADIGYAWILRGGGGGGGRGANTSLAGYTEPLPNIIGDYDINLIPPTGGTLTVSGNGGINEGGGSEFGSDYSGSGGGGGLIASAGAKGGLHETTGGLNRRFSQPGLGGAAGKAIVGKSFITYEVTGTITGVQE